jgi:hypothetical protein
MTLRRVTSWWIAQVAAGWGARAGDSLTFAVQQSSTSLGTIDPRRLGEQLATRSHAIDEVLEWVEVLIASRPRHAARLLGSAPEEQLAASWADRTLLGDAAGLGVQVEELTLRIHERFALAASVGVNADDVAAVVVAALYPAFDRPIADGVVAAVGHARAVFRHGETVAQHPSGHVLVLTDRSVDLAANLAAWKQRLDGDSALRTTHVWIEPMGGDPALVESLLVGLVSNS